jgi:hypothetical protein
MFYGMPHNRTELTYERSMGRGRYLPNIAQIRIRFHHTSTKSSLFHAESTARALFVLAPESIGSTEWIAYSDFASLTEPHELVLTVQKRNIDKQSMGSLENGDMNEQNQELDLGASSPATLLTGLVRNDKAAAELGVNPVTLRRICAASGGALKEIRIGRRVFYERAQLSEFLRGGRQRKRR